MNFPKRKATPAGEWKPVVFVTPDGDRVRVWERELGPGLVERYNPLTKTFTGAMARGRVGLGPFQNPLRPRNDQKWWDVNYGRPASLPTPVIPKGTPKTPVVLGPPAPRNPQNIPVPKRKTGLAAPNMVMRGRAW